MMNAYDLIVIGGGAAGMFAAVQAGYAGARVLLLEPNERLGKKLLITGKGRCNLTNNCPWQEVLKNVPRNARFLYSALSGFTPEDAITFFESHGCETKTERGNRVFPVSDKSASVLEALKTALGYAGVEIVRARAKELCVEDARISGVRTDRGCFYAPAVILATGGKSYPATGSTGDGYRLAKALGHSIVPPVGSLVPLVEDGTWCAQMQGLALRNIEIKLLDENGKSVFSEFGELLFTHFGLSGPVILSASAHMEPGKAYVVSIDLKPALDEEKLDARILRDFAESKNRSFENALSGLYPKTMIPVIVARSGIPGDTKVNAVTKEQRRRLLELTKHFTVQISGLRPVEEAIITSGGVATREIDPKTMESKLVPGLYFAGEVIDVDAYTGGFNLQIAWSTAYAAANAATGQWA
ncbi:MAG: NAD(P)/FAD-dependent oxidoreductase [Oscillospiraceae bacterium]|nr:NAD(P)/FAD-dependent oxidoreductase [Oscillospiraceae bacterium]